MLIQLISINVKLKMYHLFIINVFTAIERYLLYFKIIVLFLWIWKLMFDKWIITKDKLVLYNAFLFHNNKHIYQ
jgi:hypothetical protein